VCNFLYDASKYGIIIRVVEGPFIRRVAKLRESQGAYWNSEDYLAMHEDLVSELGEPSGMSTLSKSGTMDGDGIIFVSHDGTINPGGFAPAAIANIKAKDLVEAYRNDPMLVKIRSRKFNGACGSCDFTNVCGGSRARAFASCGDIYGSDPACIRVAASMHE
jgi:radical SAM protein with 4Fe4S-binding SPASM domain